MALDEAYTTCIRYPAFGATDLGGFQGLIAAGGISGSTRSSRGLDSMPQVARIHIGIAADFLRVD